MPREKIGTKEKRRNLSEGQRTRVSRLVENRETASKKADGDLVTEISNYAWNTESVYRMVDANTNNLVRKRENGTYTEEGVLLASQNIGRASLKNYQAEFGSMQVTKWDRIAIAFEIQERMIDATSDAIVYKFDPNGHAFGLIEREIESDILQANRESNELIKRASDPATKQDAYEIYNRDALKVIWNGVTDKALAKYNAKKKKQLFLSTQEKSAITNDLIRHYSNGFDSQMRYLRLLETQSGDYS